MDKLFGDERFVYAGHTSSAEPGGVGHLVIDTGSRPIERHWFGSREEAEVFVEKSNAEHRARSSMQGNQS